MLLVEKNTTNFLASSVRQGDDILSCMRSIDEMFVLFYYNKKKVLMMPFLSFSSGRTLMALDWNRKNAPWFYWEEKKWNWNWNWKVTQSSCMKISRRIQTMLNFPGIINYTDLFIDVKDKKLTVCMNHSLGQPNWMSLDILFVLLSPLPFWWIDRILIAASFYHLEAILAKQLLCTVLCTTHRL